MFRNGSGSVRLRKRWSRGSRRFKIDDGFARFCVAELFSGEPLDCFGIFFEVANGAFQQFMFLLLHPDLVFQDEDLFAHAGILLKNWQVPEKNTEKTRQNNEPNNKMGKALPNSEIDLLIQTPLFSLRRTGESMWFVWFCLML